MVFACTEYFIQDTGVLLSIACFYYDYNLA